METTTKPKGLDPFEITIMLVRASGPVTKEQIARELLAQCQWTRTQDAADRQAVKAIEHGLSRGYLWHHDAESYILAVPVNVKG